MQSWNAEPRIYASRPYFRQKNSEQNGSHWLAVYPKGTGQIEETEIRFPGSRSRGVYCAVARPVHYFSLKLQQTRFAHMTQYYSKLLSQTLSVILAVIKRWWTVIQNFIRMRRICPPLHQNVQNLSAITASECAESVRHYNIRMCRICPPLQHQSVQNLSPLQHQNMQNISAITTSECSESIRHYNIRMCRISPPL